MLNKAISRIDYVTTSINTKIGKMQLIENLKYQKRDMPKKQESQNLKPNALNSSPRKIPRS